MAYSSLSSAECAIRKCAEIASRSQPCVLLNPHYAKGVPQVSKRKSWHEKLADSKDLPKVTVLCGKMRDRFGSGTMVIPAPSEVDAIMKKVPKGKLITINEIRSILAQRHGATMTCPITAGIFAWIAAHAAEEA